MLLYIIAFLVVLSVLVFAHELGHFWTARKFGAKVEEFGFGLPPRIFGIRKIDGKWQYVRGQAEIEETSPIVYSLNWIPVGGFVKIKGENGSDEQDQDSFAAKPIWQRAIMLAAGVVMNVILCIVLLSIGFGLGLPAVLDEEIDNGGKIISNQTLQVLEVLPDLPAQDKGLQIGDTILEVDGQPFVAIGAVKEYFQNKAGQEVTLKLRRHGEEIEETLTVVEYQEVVGIGVALVETAIVKYPWYSAIWQGIKTTYLLTITITVALYNIIKNLIIGAPVGVEVAGPVGIAVLTGQMTKMGFIYLLQFTALLSLNLAIINILPFPALDGGRLLFLAIEKIRGKAIKPQWENLANNVGFILLMLLVLFFTIKDVSKYGQGIWGAISGLFG